MNKTPTPRTDEAWAAWQYAGSGMSVHVGRELERELTAVTEQRDEWKAKFIQQNKDLGCEMMDPDGTIWDYAKKLQTELPAVTQQLTKANETIGTMIDEIGMLQLKDKATTEQRDRLAEALRKIKNAGGTYTDHHDELDFIDGITYEALQSLKQNALAQASADTRPTTKEKN